MSLSSDSEVTGPGVIRIPVTTQMFLLTLITAVQTMLFAVTELVGFNTQPVPASPASFTFRLVVITVTTGRVRTFLTVLVLRPLVLYEALLVTGALVGWPPVPGPTACILVSVVEVTAVVRGEDSFIVTLGTVLLPITHLQKTDPLLIGSTGKI